MVVEFTCLSCTRTFQVPIDDLPRLNYLECNCCGKPVAIDLLDSLKQVCGSLTMQNNQSSWHIRFKKKS